MQGHVQWSLQYSDQVWSGQKQPSYHLLGPSLERKDVHLHVHIHIRWHIYTCIYTCVCYEQSSDSDHPGIRILCNNPGSEHTILGFITVVCTVRIYNIYGYSSWTTLSHACHPRQKMLPDWLTLLRVQRDHVMDTRILLESESATQGWSRATTSYMYLLYLHMAYITLISSECLPYENTKLLICTQCTTHTHQLYKSQVIIHMYILKHIATERPYCISSTFVCTWLLLVKIIGPHYKVLEAALLHKPHQTYKYNKCTIQTHAKVYMYTCSFFVAAYIVGMTYWKS